MISRIDIEDMTDAQDEAPDVEALYGAIRRLIVAVHEVCDDEQREGEWLSGALAEAHSVLPPIGYRAALAAMDTPKGGGDA